MIVFHNSVRYDHPAGDNLSGSHCHSQMTYAQIVKTSIDVITNSPFRDYTHLYNHISPTNDVHSRFKPLTVIVVFRFFFFILKTRKVPVQPTSPPSMHNSKTRYKCWTATSSVVLAMTVTTRVCLSSLCPQHLLPLKAQNLVIYIIIYIYKIGSAHG